MLCLLMILRQAMQYFIVYKKITVHFALSVILLLGTALLDTTTGSIVMANNGQASQKAMKLAEKQTNGKALKTKYFEQGNKKGYKVRILKEGKISHVFIGLNRLK